MYQPDTEPEFDTFTDLLFNACVGFAFFFFLTFAMVNPVAKTGEVDTTAEMLVTVSWPDHNIDDVDVYVQDPQGNIVWYHQREAGFMHLDRDDRGMFKDVLLVNGVEQENPLNQEIVSFRGLMDGEYRINVVHYIANSTEPLPVTVKVEKLNPSLRVLYYGSVLLNGTGDEKTVVGFTLRGSEIEDINDRQVSLVQLTRNAARPEVPQFMDPGTGQEVK